MLSTSRSLWFSCVSRGHALEAAGVARPSVDGNLFEAGRDNFRRECRNLYGSYASQSSGLVRCRPYSFVGQRALKVKPTPKRHMKIRRKFLGNVDRKSTRLNSSH